MDLHICMSAPSLRASPEGEIMKGAASIILTSLLFLPVADLNFVDVQAQNTPYRADLVIVLCPANS